MAASSESRRAVTTIDASAVTIWRGLPSPIYCSRFSRASPMLRRSTFMPSKLTLFICAYYIIGRFDILTAFCAYPRGDFEPARLTQPSRHGYNGVLIESCYIITKTDATLEHAAKRW